MSRIEAFLQFLWDFVIGDDWRIAAGVGIALGVAAVLSNSTNAWWILPIAVAALLWMSLASAVRKRGG